VNRAVDTIVRDQNITVILAAHRLSTIAQAERVIVLENGAVSEEGPYSVLVSQFSYMSGLPLSS
jgi:ATP-binding cassette subfamily B (MDR/TAP) protein 10